MAQMRCLLAQKKRLDDDGRHTIIYGPLTMASIHDELLLEPITQKVLDRLPAVTNQELHADRLDRSGLAWGRFRESAACYVNPMPDACDGEQDEDSE
jgi:hypothetical protein